MSSTEASEDSEYQSSSTPSQLGQPRTTHQLGGEGRVDSPNDESMEDLPEDAILDVSSECSSIGGSKHRTDAIVEQRQQSPHSEVVPSSEDDSRSSPTSMESAQPRSSIQLKSGGRLSDVSMGDASEASIPDASSDHSSAAGPPEHAQVLDVQPEQSARSEDATPSAKRSPLIRPNKYHGPASTWRDWTKHERQIAASLDQLRAKDLSTHLYNFYCLKRMVDSSTEWQVETDQDTDDDLTRSRSRKAKAWLPVKTWTAWPVDPIHVPREADEPKWEYKPTQTMANNIVASSSGETLLDLLVAQACKKAKERLQRREWEDFDVELPGEDVSQSRLHQLAGSADTSKQFEPVVMADDERARGILQPSLNHILQKLDALLLGLHHARASYATYNRWSTSTQPVTDHGTSMGRKRKRSMSRASRSRTVSRPRKAAPNPSGDTSEAAPDSVGPTIKTKTGLGLRDWSDVLGVASMCGFPSEVVARAAARCSTLFEEGIVFRTLHEGKKHHREVSYLPDVLSAEALLQAHRFEPEEDNSHDSSEDAKVGAVHVDGFMQPIEKQKSWGRRARRKKR
ncbi:MAG: hypothetical protein Q9166_008028 [cf. Caloplaca sp. 2 TL-2023]